MNKKCRLSGRVFTLEVKDRDFYQKMEVPPPTLCPEERLLRRLSFRNESSIYKRKCDSTGRQIVSLYSQDKPFIVYDNEYWWGDAWDALRYGRDFNFALNFFPQFSELLRAVPKMARIQQGEQINSQFTNCAANNKNCYLIFSSYNSEDCFYGKNVNNSRSSLDCFACNSCELCYACTHSDSCYNCQSIRNCKNCHDCYFLENCIACDNCIACVNLRSKSFCILNRQMSREAYFQALGKINLGSCATRTKLKLKFDDLIKSFAIPNLYGQQNDNVSGNYLWNCSNTRDSYYCNNLEDCRYCNEANSLKDSYDISFYGATGNNELLYECEGVGHNVSNIKFSKLIWGGSSNIYYSYECFACHNILGCAGLRNAEYCIFNKQYSKNEYFQLRERIISHMKDTAEWGEFFPAALSPFNFNETVAYEYFPLSRREAESRGFRWATTEKEKSPGSKILPDCISEANSEFVGKALTCEKSGRNYRIEMAELNFYLKQNIPIPRQHYLERLKAISSRADRRDLTLETCKGCSRQIITANAGLIYCEGCFLEQVI